jgi:ABC-type ATPase involved in cell division
MEHKIKILVPDKKKHKVTLENLNKLYSDIGCVFEYSDDNEFHILKKLETEDDVFCVFINVKNMVVQEAKNHIYDVMETYKYDEDCEGCKFVFLPTRVEEDKIIKLSNTSREISIMH